jgi:putative transcriptional regulator
MTFVRVKSTDIDREKLLRELAARPMPSEEEINRHAIEDDSVTTEADWARAVVVYPPPTAEQVRALRQRLGLSQSQFARKFGFGIDTLQQYEQGRRVPSGPASSLLRVIEAEPEAVIRALGPR